jgi:hypothetical protein
MDEAAFYTRESRALRDADHPRRPCLHRDTRRGSWGFVRTPQRRGARGCLRGGGGCSGSERSLGLDAGGMRSGGVWWLGPMGCVARRCAGRPAGAAALLAGPRGLELCWQACGGQAAGRGARREELGYGCAGLARGAGRPGLFG